MVMRLISILFLANLALGDEYEYISFSPMDCKVDKREGVMVIGQFTWQIHVASEDVCVSVCYQYDQSGPLPCKSVNYFTDKNLCQMMRDTYETSTQKALLLQKTTNYIEVKECKEYEKPPTLPPPPSKASAATFPTLPPPPSKATPRPGTNETNPGSGIRPGSCGQSTVPLRSSQFRVVGGHEAARHSVPFIVSLRKMGRHNCGGTLIRVSPNREETDIVVTAAHCIGDGRFDVVAGAHYASRQVNGEDKARAQHVVIHPSYHKPGTSANDIAIVKLDRPIRFSQTIQPACLPESPKDDPTEGTRVIVAGWGATEQGTETENLMQTSTPVIGSDRCIRIHDEIYDECRQVQHPSSCFRHFIHPQSMLCAGSDRGERGACYGDSGGPLFIQRKQGYTLLGAVSWGAGCLPHQAITGPAIYARVSTYLDWIQQQIQSLSSIRDKE